MELPALEGLKYTLSRYKPVVYFEYDHRFDVPPKLRPRSWLRRLGYECVPNDSERAENVTINATLSANVGCRVGYCDLTCAYQKTRPEMYAFLLRWRWSRPNFVPTKAHEDFMARARPGMGRAAAA